VPVRVAPSQLTIREIIGQLMMPALPDTKDLVDRAVWQRVVDDQARYAFGGYIVFRGDAKETPPLLEELQDLSDVPMIISADLERGAGQQLAGLTNFPHMMALGAARDPDLAFQHGAITAIEARRAGIHWIFAPTLDLVNRPDNPIINVRGIGDEPRLVGNLAAAFVEGVQRHGGLACGKHFPGHGATSADSHHELPVLDISRHRLESQDLLPFRHCISAGLKSIMVGHLAVTSLDENGLPASMSKRIVSDLLREQLGFQGLVVTDALNMGAIAERYDPGYAAVRAIQAGCDVLLMPPDPEAVVEAVLRAIEEGGLTKHRLLESCERIDQARLELGLWRFGDEDDEPVPPVAPDYEPAVVSIAEAAMTLVENHGDLLPLAEGARVCSLMLDDDDDDEVQAAWRAALADHPDVLVKALGNGDDEAAIDAAVAQAAQFDVVIVPIFMWVRAAKSRVFLPELLASVPSRLKAAGAKVVAVSFSSPFLLRQFPEVDAYVCGYSPNAHCQRAAVQAIYGRQRFTGRLPVDIEAPTAPAVP
jgi:beta-N-acetylhexosaminidase